MDAYAEFLATKAIRAAPVGIEPGPMPDAMKPFQADITGRALRLGRAAIFAGTGLGKSLMQLAWARRVAEHTGKPVLLVAPLAVTHQTIAEARKFGIDGAAYSDEHWNISSPLVVTNYERVEKFNISLFGGIVLDESGIIKSHESKTRIKLMDLCRGVPFKLCATATPAPNDYVELGNHAEFLDIMTQKEMLATWFVHDGSIRATSKDNKGQAPRAEWRLKGHAEHDFWRWVSTWAVMVQHPRDIGYDEPGYDLPPLRKTQIVVLVEYRSSTGTLFPMQANTLQERLGARRESVDARVQAAARIVNGSPDKSWLVWCHLNDEADQVASLIPGCVNVQGSDAPDVKTKHLIDFAEGRLTKLATKAKIAGWGMNFQVCHSVVCVGLNDSFEELYQIIRRCWRFGQTHPVDVYMIASELEGAVVANLEAKERAYDAMFAAMSVHMKDLTMRALRRSLVDRSEKYQEPMRLPSWM